MIKQAGKNAVALNTLGNLARCELTIDYAAVKETTKACIRKKKEERYSLTPLVRQDEETFTDKLKEALVDLDYGISNVRLESSHPPLLVKTSCGEKASVALAIITFKNERGFKKVGKASIIQSAENKWQVIVKVDEDYKEYGENIAFKNNLTLADKYCLLTDAYKDALYELSTKEEYQKKAIELKVETISPQAVIREVKKELKKLIEDENLLLAKFTNTAERLVARLGQAINWDSDSPYYLTLKSLIELCRLTYSFSDSSPKVKVRLKDSAKDVLNVVNNPEAGFSHQARIIEYSLQIRAFLLLGVMREVFSEVDGAIRFNTRGKKKLEEKLNSLKQDQVLQISANILGKTEIIKGFSEKALRDFFNILLDALRKNDLSLLEAIRKKIFHPIMKKCKSDSGASGCSYPDVAIQLLSDKNSIPDEIFHRFVEINNRTARDDTSDPRFMGTEKKWNAQELKELFVKHNGVLITASSSKGRTPNFCYLLFRKETPFAADKDEILKQQWREQGRYEAPSVVAHYTYLIAGDRDFSKNLAQQGLDLYKLVERVAEILAYNLRADHLLARVREGNFAVASHERVGWEVGVAYPDSNGPFKFKVMRVSTFPIA